MDEIKWIKVSTGIFNDDAFMIIDDMPECDAIELIWFKLLVYAGRLNHNGLFLYKDTIAYTDEMLASIFRRPVNIVRLAMQTFMTLKMIEQIEGVYSIPNWDKYQSNLDAYEKRKERDRINSQNYRDKQRLLVQQTAEKVIENKSSDDSSDDASADVSRFCSYSYSDSNSISDSISDSVKEIIDYLNIKCNKHYTYKNKSNISHIKARLSEGFTVDDFKTVIDNKANAWLDDPKMCDYLRPETLFCGRFESYLNEQAVKPKQKSSVEGWLDVGRRIAEGEY